MNAKSVALSAIALMFASTTLAWADDDRAAPGISLCIAVQSDIGIDHDADRIADACDPDAEYLRPGFDFTDDDELVFGTYLADTMNGRGGDDTLYGWMGDDVLAGGEGHDVIIGGVGDDRLTGGPGCDLFKFDTLGTDFDTITDFTPGEDRLLFERAEGNIPVHDVEITPVGARFSFASGSVILLAGLDEVPDINATGCIEPVPLIPTTVAPKPTTVAPTTTTSTTTTTTTTSTTTTTTVPDPNETLIGGPGDDTLDGRAGDDQLYGLGGNDTLIGGPDDDLLDGGDGFDIATYLSTNPLGFDYAFNTPTSFSMTDRLGDEGTDTIVDVEKVQFDGQLGPVYAIVAGSEGVDSLVGTFGSRNLVLGFGGGDTLVGDTTSDVYAGTTGSDAIIGGGGNDTLYGDTSNDLEGTATGGDDTITGGDGDDTIYGDAGDDLKDEATGGDDTITGGDGNDTIYGDAGGDLEEDTTAGNDTITGGAGDDTIYGDAGGLIDDEDATGSDTFVYDLSTDQGNDGIFDFETAKDTLLLGGVSDFDGDLDSDVADLEHPSSGMSVSDDGDDVTIVFGANGSVRIYDIGTGALSTFTDLAAAITLQIAAG